MIGYLLIASAWVLGALMIVYAWREIENSPLLTGHWRCFRACLALYAAPWVVMGAHWIVDKVGTH